MCTLSDLPSGWVVWSDEPGGPCVLAYRPDVFDSQAFPAACLPTLYATPGSTDRRPGHQQYESESWRVTLFLEPGVVHSEAPTFDDREAAIEGVLDLAARFSAGQIDYRDDYQVPREAYLDRLDELTGCDEQP